MRLDEETGMMKEEIISEKQSHGRVHDRQMGAQGIRGRSTRDSIVKVQSPKDSFPQPQYKI